MAKTPTEPDSRPARTRGLTWRHIVGAVLLTVAAGVLVLGWYISTRVIWTDGEDLLREDAIASIRSVLWTNPQPLPGRPNSPQDDYEPSIAATGDRVLFVRGRPGENTDLFESRLRADGMWSQPLPITAINTDADELTPRVTADGRWLLFSSDRPGGQGAYDLWAAPRDEGSTTGWGQPFNLGPSVNSPYNDYSPTLDPTGRRLYFTTDRDAAEQLSDGRPWKATIRSAAIDDFDLYTAETVAAPLEAGPEEQSGEGPTGDAPPPPRLAFADAVELQGVNTPHREGATAISPAGDFLYFVSNRPGGEGGFDLYRARLKDGMPTEVASLGPEINTDANETDPDLAFDGFTLLFSSDRFDPGTGYDLMVARSREVYAERRGGMGWTWWVLASVLALLALLFIGGFENRHLNVLQKAAIISLLIHLLLVLLFAVWDVTKEVVRYLGEDEGQMIVSTEAARMARMTEAARSQVTPLNTAPKPPPPTERRAAPAPPPPVRRQAARDTPRPVNAQPLMDVRFRPAETPTPPEPVPTEVEPAPLPIEPVELVEVEPVPPRERVALIEEAEPVPPRATIESQRRDQPAPQTVRRESDLGDPAAAAPAETTIALDQPVDPDPLSDAVAMADPLPVELDVPVQAAAAPPVDDPADTPRDRAQAVADAEVEPTEARMLADAGPAEVDDPVDTPIFEDLMPSVDATDAVPAMPDLALATADDAPLPLTTAGEDIELNVRNIEADARLLDPASPAAARLQQRQAAQREELLRERGGDEKTENAVTRALAYLASQQYPDGHWTKHDRNRPKNNATSKVDTALTGLSVLAFLGHGEAPDRLELPYHDHVGRGLDWLLSVQGDNGDLRGGKGRAGRGHDDGNMYAHAIATIALAEAATVTERDMAKRDAYRKAALEAADYIVRAQLDDGGWRYAPSWEKNDRGDTSVVGWQVMALAAVSRPPMNYRIPDEVKAKAIGFLDDVATGEHKGLAAYQKGRGATPAMSAEAAFSRILLGDTLDSEQLRELQQYLLERPHRPGGGEHGKQYYALYYSALALMQARLKYEDINPQAWDQWNAALKAWLPKAQHTGGDHDGSWDPNTRWSSQGGRIYSTALPALTLQVYYRYDKIGGDADAADE